MFKSRKHFRDTVVVLIESRVSLQQLKITYQCEIPVNQLDKALLHFISPASKLSNEITKLELKLFFSCFSWSYCSNCFGVKNTH